MPHHPALSPPRPLLLLLLLCAFVLIALSLRPAEALAQGETRPFILPFRDLPGPDTWILGQAYGNTTGAYRQRNSTYRAGQGIHFGVDFTAPCGSAVVAIGDGVVFAVDNMNFGSAPHNLMIDHKSLGYASFYGHLLARPNLRVGQQVKAGEVVAVSGDDDGGCGGGAHLHLEIRDLRHNRKYNPVTLIAADWDNLSLTTASPRTFEYDLDNPRKWQHLDNQPESVIGGPLLNNFARPWPRDTRRP